MRRRAVLAVAALTALVALLDLTGLVDLAPLRTAAGAALGPLERLAAPSAPEDEADALRSDVADAVDTARGDDEVRRLLAVPGLDGSSVVVARVVGVGRSGAAGPERVTIDAGSRDGVEVDRTVVAAEGLVGRVVAVAPWTSDVLLLGGPDVAVGVRVGEDGVLGEASGTAAAGGAPLAPGSLGLSLVERGAMAAGDAVVTLGSVDARPFVPGIPVGTVRDVDPAVGRLAPTGIVDPAVDPTTLDLVAVVVDPARRTPRPVVTASAPAPAAG